MAVYRRGEIARMKEFGVLLPSKSNHEGQAQQRMPGKRLCVGLEAGGSELEVVLSSSRNEIFYRHTRGLPFGSQSTEAIGTPVV